MVVKNADGVYNHLKLNILKTKEMVIDFRKKRPEVEPVFLQGSEVEWVSVCRAGQRAGLVLPREVKLA